MAGAGERRELPDGTAFVVERSAAETGGELVQMQISFPPGNFSPLPHVHPRSADRFEVLEGRFELMVGGEWRTFGPGEVGEVPAMSVHTQRNRSDGWVRVRNTHRPAVRFEAYLEHMHALALARGIRSGRDWRTPILLAMVAREYPDTIRWGRRRDRALMAALAALGRALRWSTVP